MLNMLKIRMRIGPIFSSQVSLFLYWFYWNLIDLYNRSSWWGMISRRKSQRVNSMKTGLNMWFWHRFCPFSNEKCLIQSNYWMILNNKGVSFINPNHAFVTMTIYVCTLHSLWQFFPVWSRPVSCCFHRDRFSHILCCTQYSIIQFQCIIMRCQPDKT